MKFVSKWKTINQILNNNYTKHEFRKILAISGKPGLYVLKVQTRTGFVAENVMTEKNHSKLKSNVSLLSEISVYTYEGENH
jgi:hypothetical protein